MKPSVFGLLLLATSGLASCPALTASAQAGARPLRVMILTDGPSPQLVTPIKVFRTELVELLGGNVEFVTPPIASDWTMQGVTQALDAALADRSVRLIVGFGVRKRSQSPCCCRSRCRSSRGCHERETGVVGGTWRT